MYYRPPLLFFLQHPITRPNGGKHADDPKYRADQPLPHPRASNKKNPNVIPMGATNGLLCTEGEDGEFLFDETSFPAGAEGDIASYMFPAHDVTSKAATRRANRSGAVGALSVQRGARTQTDALSCQPTG